MLRSVNFVLIIVFNDCCRILYFYSTQGIAIVLAANFNTAPLRPRRLRRFCGRASLTF
ncbi:hypothetical protein MPC4_20169 [Methylocella tundrae]|uniref:Uncharacterized protein n=1 Tax=Methylocella tundrae TaxID=227605 RepID=A0A8B6M6B6_METTU|nr:hypothetical protein MPC1_3410003 [Methylocella tundrae]VTZ49959.1 hypothetical protein MPC4_20169 [Methylocella tundrae]